MQHAMLWLQSNAQVIVIILAIHMIAGPLIDESHFIPLHSALKTDESFLSVLEK